MADTTPVYGLPFQELGDAPDGPTLSEDLAQGVEDELVRIDAAIATINGLTHAFAASTTDETGFTNTTFDAGASPVGVAFTAPPSGVVIVHFSVYMQQNINGQASIASVEVKTGAVIGSGTLAGGAANSDRAIVCGKAVNASAPALLQASRDVLYSGLTPGASYNARIMKAVDGGSGALLYREIIVQPLL